MIYFVLITGLVIIYAALKKSTAKNSNSDFNDVLKQKTSTSSVDSLIAKINELNERVDELENAFLLYQPEFNSTISKVKEIPVLKTTESSSKTVPQDTINTNKNFDDNYYINEQIYSLYDNGNSIEEIASLLHIGKGEVSLRLGLRKQKM